MNLSYVLRFPELALRRLSRVKAPVYCEGFEVVALRKSAIRKLFLGAYDNWTFEDGKSLTLKLSNVNLDAFRDELVDDPIYGCFDDCRTLFIVNLSFDETVEKV